jgi:hypothetical protein
LLHVIRVNADHWFVDQLLVICQILLEMQTHVQKLFIPRSWFVTIPMLCVTLIMLRHDTHACSS